MASVDPHTAVVANSAGSLGVSDSKVKDNRIKITFYKWTCVENCQQLLMFYNVNPSWALRQPFLASFCHDPAEAARLKYLEPIS